MDAQWSVGLTNAPPEGADKCKQKSWDTIKASNTAEGLLADAPDPRLLAYRVKETGAWLDVLPISSLGLRMNDNTIRVAVGLRLGAPLCRPHSCYHCGAGVDSLGTHGLSCRSSEGRHHRHAALNDIVHRTLTSAKIPARLEPSGLQRSDGKRPDGITMVPWKCGKLHAGVGRDLPGHLSPIIHHKCYLGGRACSCRSRREDGGQIHQP